MNTTLVLHTSSDVQTWTHHHCCILESLKFHPEKKLCACYIRQMKQSQQEENELTVFDVKEGNQDSEQSSHGDLTHQLPVAMVGTECQCAFAQVSQTLRRHKQKRVNSSSCTLAHPSPKVH